MANLGTRFAKWRVNRDMKKATEELEAARPEINAANQELAKYAQGAAMTVANRINAVAAHIDAFLTACANNGRGFYCLALHTDVHNTADFAIYYVKGLSDYKDYANNDGQIYAIDGEPANEKQVEVKQTISQMIYEKRFDKVHIDCDTGDREYRTYTPGPQLSDELEKAVIDIIRDADGSVDLDISPTNERINEFMRSYELGGARRKAHGKARAKAPKRKPAAAAPAWQRAGRKAPDGRALWRSSKTGELRVRTMVTDRKTGARRAKYVKP